MPFPLALAALMVAWPLSPAHLHQDGDHGGNRQSCENTASDPKPQRRRAAAAEVPLLLSRHEHSMEVRLTSL